MICATSYRRGLESLVGRLEVLNDVGPLATSGNLSPIAYDFWGLAAPIAVQLRHQALATHGQPNRQ